MQQRLTQHTPGTARLILFFAGWAMDSRPFEHLCRPGYDVMVVWDYRDDSFDYEALAAYSEIVVVAWSFGVYGADRALSGRNIPLTATVAVNGTLYPVDDERGIPRRVFALTLRGICSSALDTFNRRMCGSDERYDLFMASAPQRPIDEVVDELRRFDCQYPQTADHLQWNHIVVGRRDAIIDFRNQLRAWGQERCTVIDDGCHLIDMQRVIDRFVVAKDVVAKSFRRHADTYDSNAGIQARVAGRLWRLASEYLPSQLRGTTVEIGSGTGLLTRHYIDRVDTGSLQLWDISGTTPDISGVPQVTECDAELEIRRLPDRSVDLLLSSATLQWFNDLPTFMRHTRRVLRPDGFAVYSYFTSGTCAEVAALTGNSLPFGAEPTAADDVVYMETEDICCLFDSPSEVLRHLRLTGVNSLGNKHIPAAGIRRIIDAYPLTADGKAPLTYRVSYLIIKANG